MNDRVDDEREGDAMALELVAPSLLHELRQPLTGAEAAALLLERTQHGLEQVEEWRLLRAQLARLAEIADEYEALLTSGDAAPARFAVGPVVARAVDLLAHRVRPLAQRFALAGQDGAGEAFGAPAAIVHAATNLLANALDAVEGAGSSARIAVRVLPRQGGGVEVRISDEGVGITAENRRRLFEPRFTTKGPGRGSGLGLHVARRLMRRYGGDVLLVANGDPARAPWAVTEFCVVVPPPPGSAA
jgi:C4-dicarboxylate-specific signal transduction histidine kinase